MAPLEVLEPKTPVKRMVFHEITREAIDERHREPARPRHEAGRGAGRSAHPRPARRLRGVAGAVAARRRRTLGRTGAERRGPAGRRARARAHGVPQRGVLGPRRPLRRARHGVRRHGSWSSTAGASRHGRDFDAATGMLAPDSDVGAPRRDRRARARRPPRRHQLHRRDVEAKTFVERPKPPFKTTTLQQEAGRKLRLQRRPHDVGRAGPLRAWATSPTCGPTPSACRTRRSTRPGPRSSSGTARPTCRRRRARTRNKMKNAQEAHEAIRPAGDRFRTPEDVRGELVARRAAALRADLDAHGRVAR